MDKFSARKIIDAARVQPLLRQRVYPGTPEFSVLLSYSPIPGGFLRSMPAHQRWVLLTEYTNVDPTNLEMARATEWELYRRAQDDGEYNAASIDWIHSTVDWLVAAPPSLRRQIATSVAGETTDDLIAILLELALRASQVSA